MKAGLLYGDVINTVSKKYATEIQTPELGEGWMDCSGNGPWIFMGF